MKITTEETKNGAFIIAPQGELDALSATQLRARVDPHLYGNYPDYLVDLSAVTALDSAGLTALVSFFMRARRQGSRVRFVPSRHVKTRRMLHLTKFDRVFSFV